MFGLKPEVINLFTPFFQYTNGRLIFQYGNKIVESWAPGWHRVPSTSEFWLANADHPNLITDLFISYSAAELLCFTSQRAFLFKYPEQHAFAALGLLPSPAQVAALKAAFPLARWHLIFDANLVGRVLDAAIATWFKGRSVSFQVNDEQVLISYSDKPFVISSGDFSLSRFERITGLRAGMRTHKPLRGVTSFIELQIANNDT
ncbi:MAG: hypothetical protein ABI166_15370 [Mucilaginibacter sp.]